MTILEKVLERYSLAKKRGFKDIRLNLDEVDELVVMITKTMSRNEEFADKVIDLQAEIIELQKKSTGIDLSDLEIEGDGGTW